MRTLKGGRHDNVPAADRGGETFNSTTCAPGVQHRRRSAVGRYGREKRSAGRPSASAP